MSKSLTFEELRKHNLSRCEGAFEPLDNWSPTDWGCALAGEVGELCNMIKKLRRKGFSEKETARRLPAIAKELADIQIYLDLTAARLRVNLAEATIDKFNEISKDKGSDVRLVGYDIKEKENHTPPSPTPKLSPSKHN